MIVTAVKTDLVRAGDSLFGILDDKLDKLPEGSVVAVTSKIVSLCQNRVVPLDSVEKSELVKQEAELYLPKNYSRYNHGFTIINHTLIASAGIDESNGDNEYVLWPEDAQQTANNIREHLATKFNLQKIGVIITDSTCQPLRRGTTGIVLAHSGFDALNNYIGKPDLFGRPFSVSQANIASGLAAAAVLAMGEGTEQTPLAVLSDLPFVKFQNRNPNEAELSEVNISLQDDLFAPFLENVNWETGDRN